MVVAIAELGDVLMQMAESDFVVLPDDAALQQAPESFDGVGMNFAIGIGEFVIDRAVWHESFDSDIALVLVRDENRIVAVNVLANEFRDALMSQFCLINWFGNNATTAFYHAHYRNLLSSARAERPLAITLTRLSADKGLVHFHDAPEQFSLLKHGVANPHSHVPCRTLVHFQIAGQLASGETFLGVQHKGDRQEPFLQRQMGMVEDRVHGDTEAGVAVVAVMAVFVGRRAGRSAVRAHRNPMPADGFNMADAIFFSGKFGVDLNDVHGYPLLGHLKYRAKGESCQEKSSTVN